MPAISKWAYFGGTSLNHTANDNSSNVFDLSMQEQLAMRDSLFPVAREKLSWVRSVFLSSEEKKRVVRNHFQSFISVHPSSRAPRPAP